MSATVTCPRCWGLGNEPPKISGPCAYCHGAGRVEDVALSAHFRFGEWCRPHEGCPNDPPAEALARARLTLEHLVEPARAALGVALTVTSGYRCAELDVLADRGNRRWLLFASAHQLGSAFDLRPADPRVSLLQLLDALRTHATAPWDQLIAEGGCIHAALEGPSPAGRPLPVGQGARRGHVLVRVAVADPKPGASAFRYELFDGTAGQADRIV